MPALRTKSDLTVVALAALAVLAVGVFVSRSAPESYDAGIMVQVTQSLVDDASVEVRRDEFGFNSPYASYGLGFSLLMVPADVVAEAVGADRNAAVMLTNPAVLALVAVVILVWTRLTGASARTGLVTTALVVFGTLLLPYAATGFSELAVALGVALVLLALEAAHHGRSWAGVLAGSAAGLAVLCRTESVVLVAPVALAGVWWAGGRSWLPLGRFAVGFTPWLAMWAAYNHIRFGAPWRLGYAGFGFTKPFMEGFHGLTVSSGRGVLWFTPLVVVAAIGWRSAHRRAPVIAVSAAAIFVLRPLFFASWTAWDGGVCWGPRFLVPAMPVLAVGTLEVVRSWSRWSLVVRSLVVVVAATSVWIQVVGAAVAYETFWNETVAPRGLATGDARFHLYDWSESPILGESRFLLRGHGLASRYLRPETDAIPIVALSACALFAAVGAWVGSRRTSRDAVPTPASTRVPRRSL